MMELFAFGMLAGVLFALILIGGMNIAMDKREPDKSGSDSNSDSIISGDSECLDRFNIEEKIEELITKLRGMVVVTGLSRTEKETLDEAADVIEVLMEGIK